MGRIGEGVKRWAIGIKSGGHDNENEGSSLDRERGDREEVNGQRDKARER